MMDIGQCSVDESIEKMILNNFAISYIENLVFEEN
jgi:hypothetical protein